LSVGPDRASPGLAWRRTRACVCVCVCVRVGCVCCQWGLVSTKGSLTALAVSEPSFARILLPFSSLALTHPPTPRHPSFLCLPPQTPIIYVSPSSDHRHFCVSLLRHPSFLCLPPLHVGPAGIDCTECNCRTVSESLAISESADHRYPSHRTIRVPGDIRVIRT
jgi:hypothetical protein